MADSADRGSARKTTAEAEPGTSARRHEVLDRRAAAEPTAAYGAMLGARPAGPQPLQRAPAPNHTGLPDGLKAGIEALSGVSLDGVKVHYNSSRPARVGAHAYAQGSDIHLAQGQERHLPHEAWHVVQQAQGRVTPTLQLAGGPSVNDDDALEREADAMGARAANLSVAARSRAAPAAPRAGAGPVVQRMLYDEIGTGGYYKVTGYEAVLYLRVKRRVGLNIFTPHETQNSPSISVAELALIERPATSSEIAAAHPDARMVQAEGEPQEAKAVTDDAISKWLMDEKGVELYDEPAVRAVRYTMALSKLPLAEIGATTSGGNSLTLLPKGVDFVVQYFRGSAFEAIERMYNALRGADEGLRKHVADIRFIDPGLGVAVVEKIIPLNAMFRFFGDNPELGSEEDLRAYIEKNASKLKAAGMSAILGLAKAGVSQGDVSFDNMGVKNGEFALFDYDKTQKASGDTVERDTHSLGKSFKTRGKLDMDQIK